MNKLLARTLAITACTAMMLTGVPMTNTSNVQAAAKTQGTINLKTAQLVIPNGKSQKIRKNALTMVKGRKYQVKAKWNGKTLRYKSSKPTVASVSRTGIVTAKKPGTATIAITRNKKKQTFRITVVANHGHAWKTTTKSTCKATGKRFCKTCGVTEKIAKNANHTYRTTTKPTCTANGQQTCSVCGKKTTVPMTEHLWKTTFDQEVQGRGTPTNKTFSFCNGCKMDMTGFTKEQIQEHQSDTGNLQCFAAGFYGYTKDVYPEYFMVKKTTVACGDCGTVREEKQEDLYECDDEGNTLMHITDETGK